MASYRTDNGSITVDGFVLPYLIEGDGREVIIIGDSVYYPRTFSPNLRQHVRLHFLSHRGFGKATRTFDTADFELDVIADDIEAFRKRLNLDKVIVAGHSGHGHMALTYAKKYPHNVSHLILLAMSPDSSTESFQAADRYLDESVCPERKALYMEGMKHLEADIANDPTRRFIHYSLRSAPRIWYDPHFDARPLWEGVEVIPEMFDYVWGKVLPAIDIKNGLDRLKIPVFLGLGRYDYWNPPYLWEVVRPYFHDLRIRVFEKSGHTPQLEEPDHVDRELLTWLREKP